MDIKIDLKHPEVFLARRSLLDSQRLQMLLRLAQSPTLLKEGNYIECGVYWGGTAALLAKILKDALSTYQLYLLDAWRGLPTTNEADEAPYLDPGALNDVSVNDVRSLLILLELEKQVQILDGWFQETLEFTKPPISFAHIDCDYYDGALLCLNKILPQMSASGIIIIDDYGCNTKARRFPGVSRAVEEARMAHPDWELSDVYGEKDHAVVLYQKNSPPPELITSGLL